MDENTKGYKVLEAAAEEVTATPRDTRIVLGVADDASHIRVWFNDVKTGKLEYFFDLSPDQAHAFAHEMLEDVYRALRLRVSLRAPMKKPPAGKVV